MKKVLLGTSAIALASAFTTQANAADWDVVVGGYMEQFVAYAGSDTDNTGDNNYNGVDSKQDTEIHFKPSITLDNGIKIGADVQLEANTAGDQIDESWLYVRGSFGEVNLGSENSAGYKMTYAAPDVTFLNVNSGSTTAFIPFSGTTNGTAATRFVGNDVFRGTLGTTYLENGRNNDAQRITYYTPRFAGFQLGASYSRDGRQDDNSQVNIENTALSNIVDFGANYVNSFGDFDVAISGRWGSAFGSGTTGQNNPTVFGGGANFGYAGFTIGGSWAEQNNSIGSLQDGNAWDAGISYETGPWGFSFTYFKGENVDNESVFNGNAFGNDETLAQYLLGVNYKLAKGVSLGAYGAYVDFEEETGDAGGSGDDVDGFIIGTGIKITF
ncbi:porin [Rhodobacteraceae bacterium NNCM2]|nr:porin [Coraliihabitans acroporae]